MSDVGFVSRSVRITYNDMNLSAYFQFESFLSSILSLMCYSDLSSPFPPLSLVFASLCSRTEISLISPLSIAGLSSTLLQRSSR
ncbi:hypothetical protein BYT27DRAFT_7186468 [Phlegmacium glaucopus]|nr:hypothetical protein BYT27DRAFT_7186657 [Phlegmacium glaucopus]KAF8810522.1 hypothetical protein BYT27DRAFT_7186468 [Phlegmacium glaucopus]